MNTKEYISSGAIESCVLGLATLEEQRELEQYCALYPEVLEAKLAFEKFLEEQALENAVRPPGVVKEKFFKEIGSGGKIRSLPASSSRKFSWLKYAAAACFILLAGSIIWNISLYNRNRELRKNFRDSRAHLDEMENDIRILRQNPAIKMASMKGMEASPQSYATVYWDTLTHDVYLLANNLPAPPTDAQYQLWAILDNKPVDLGMLDFNLRQKKLLLRMKNVQNAQAFAITLEKKGGNPTPKGPMVVKGGL